MERKHQHGGFVELHKVDQMALEKSAAAKAEFREQLRANRRRIKEALKDRPSLIERHELQMAKRNASSAALRQIAGAIKNGDYSADGIFNDEEQAKLAYDDDDN